MSTRSRIGIQMPDGKVRSIYCHCDGYLRGVGKKLIDKYQDAEKVEELMTLGGISSLRETVDETRQYAYGDDRAREDASVADFWRYAGNCGEEFIYLLERIVEPDGLTHFRWVYSAAPFQCDLAQALK